jgi:general secretion pathway protein E
LLATSGLSADALDAQLRAAFGIGFLSAADVAREFDLAQAVELPSGCRAVRAPQLSGPGFAILATDPWDLPLQGTLGASGEQGAALFLVAAAALPRAASPAPALQQPRTAERSSAATRPGRFVIDFVDSVVREAWQVGASDVHFETVRGGMRVLLRVDGILVPSSLQEAALPAEQVVSRIKVLAKLDITERRVPQDGRFSLPLDGRSLDLRVSIMPSIFGEDAVLRLLDKVQFRGTDSEIRLESLGFDTATLESIRHLASRPHGMLLVTGPTGSGKTTSLYAVVSQLRSGLEKIVTIEDPVEYELPGVLQIPVDERKGLTFARGLRSILRHDPDRILVGEIRDAETAEIAIQAALTGHLVYTTVHANNVFDVVGRFVHMNIDLPSLTSALNGVVAQRLLRTVCPHCAEPAAWSADEHALLAAHGVADRAATPRVARGCAQCRSTGYRGRTAVGEALVLDDDLRKAIVARRTLSELRAMARERGVISLESRALALAAAGVTTVDEVDRVVGVRQ